MKFRNGNRIARDWAHTMTTLPVLTKDRRGHASTPLFNYIESTTAVDASTVRMKLTRPFDAGVNMTYRYMAFILQQERSTSRSRTRMSRTIQPAPSVAPTSLRREKRRSRAWCEILN